MNVMRLNFSHGSHDDKREVIQDLRYVLNEFRDEAMLQDKKVDFSDGSQEYFCSIAADIKGPKIRTGWFAPDEKGKEVTQVILVFCLLCCLYVDTIL
jgi:pyruvate kinase